MPWPGVSEVARQSAIGGLKRRVSPFNGQNLYPRGRGKGGAIRGGLQATRRRTGSVESRVIDPKPFT